MPIVNSESGPRRHVMIVCALPAAGPSDALAAERQFEKFLCALFGGFTRSVAHGGWIPPNSQVPLMETVARYDVCCATEADLAPLRDAVCIFGEALGQQWVHVEAWTTEAHHIGTALS